MNSMLGKMRKLGDEDLYVISDAIDAEIARREKQTDVMDVSPRQRANERSQSYRRKNGTGGYVEILLRYPELQLQASGGVRNIDDLELLREIGVPAAITGRALLDGEITEAEVASFRRSE